VKINPQRDNNWRGFRCCWCHKNVKRGIDYGK